MLERGRYGVEYFPKAEHEGSGFGSVVAVIAFLALVSLSWVLYKRYAVRPPVAPVPETAPVAAEPSAAAAPAVEKRPPPAEPVAAHPKAAVTLPPSVIATLEERPVKLRNLLTRLARAVSLDMAVTTLELLREQPQAADLDSWMASELGRLNLRRLAERCPKWVREVQAKRGDSASRIASDHNCTLASLRFLNGSRLDRIRIGDTLYVMSNPHFTLVVRRRSQTADLTLEGRFFKRYELAGPVPKTVSSGLYKTTRVGATLRELGVVVSADAQKELELLMPKNSTVTITEM